VERALLLIASGTLTIAMACGAKDKVNWIVLPLMFNRATAKESTHQTGFNNAMWGKATCSYIVSARSLTNAKFDAVLQRTKPFINLKPKAARNKTTEAIEVIKIDDDDTWACLVDISDDECKFFSFFHNLNDIVVF
jgi:hypothetical protein